MTAPLAPTMQAFFTDRLVRQRAASPHTIAAYRDTMRLMLTFAQQQLSKPPSALSLVDLDAPLITAFLDHLQRERRNSARTRNARLAAIHSLFKFAALRHPEHSSLIQRVLAIPPRRFDKALVAYLTNPEIEALLAAPDRLTRAGRRDHALLVLAVRTGLRVSELVNLNRATCTAAAAPTCAASAKDESTAAPRWTSRPWKCSPTGSTNVAAMNQTTRSSQPAPAPGSAVTRWNGSSRSTPPPPA